MLVFIIAFVVGYFAVRLIRNILDPDDREDFANERTEDENYDPFNFKW